MRRPRSHTWIWTVSAVCTAGLAFGWLFQSKLLPPKNQQVDQKNQDSAVHTDIPVASDEELMQVFQRDIHPMLEQYCYDCHMDGSDKGGLDLDAFPDLASMRKNPKIWEHILARIDYHLMPPPKEKQPEKKEREKLITWINDAVFPVDPNNPDPGHVVIRRLNQIEYQNTIRDLLGVHIDAANILPPDDSGYGFDNIGSVLSISPSHVEKYLQAAEHALDKAVIIGPMPASMLTYKPTQFRGDGVKSAEGIFFFTRGQASVNAKARQAGNYLLHISASAHQAGKDPAHLEILLNNKRVKIHHVKNHISDQKTFTTQLKLRSGSNKIEIGFPNDYYDPKHQDPRRRDRNLIIHDIRLEGPTNIARKKPETHHRIFLPRKPGTSDTDYTRAVLTQFASRAFRRPVNDQEIDRYIDLVKRMTTKDQSLESGIYAALQAILVSPSFLYIAPPDNLSTSSPTLISEHALASRLSYFLWSSMPDEKLLKLANEGKLRDQLDTQVARMLEDVKAKEMIRHFSGQWLQLRDLDVVTPDRKRFRSFTRELASDMRTETEMLTDHILRGNLSLLEFLNADYTFVNDRLAHHYVMIGVKGSHFRKVTLAGTGRRGLLTHASLLTITSQPTRTSPVLRGKFVLENILDITPPPPPPDLPQLEDPKNHGKRMTLREQLALHRKKSACAGCHNLMDPVGLAFEHYDAIGRFREFDNGRKIDASGKLVTGETLENAESLRHILATQKQDEFLRCLTIKMMTYALGRGVTRTDRVTVENILRDLQKTDYRAHNLIHGIVNSVPFQHMKSQ